MDGGLGLWRAPTDNDRIGPPLERWRSAGLDRVERREVTVDRDGPAATVHATYVTGAGDRIAHERVITARNGGAIHVEETVVIPAGLDDVPRIGAVLEFTPGLEKPGVVRHRPARDLPGSSSVGAGGPLDHDGHGRSDPLRPPAGVRRPGRRPVAIPRQSVQVRRRAARPRPAAPGVGHALPRRGPRDRQPRCRSRGAPGTIVHLDVAHRGLGTASCGPDTLDAYLVGPGTYHWSWTLLDLP